VAHPDELESILERGIASYRNAEPLAGLEERVIGRIGITEMPRRRANGWLGILALPLAGMVVAGLVLIPVKRSDLRPTAAATAAVAPVRPVESAPVPVLKPQRQRSVAQVRRVRTLPKGPVFPAPSRMTGEERLMASMAATNPDEAALVFESLRRRIDDPIAIEPIVIPPISPNQGQ
jgi:hypothetical protein